MTRWEHLFFYTLDVLLGLLNLGLGVWAVTKGVWVSPFFSAVAVVAATWAATGNARRLCDD